MRKRTQAFSELQCQYLFGERFGRSARERQGQSGKPMVMHVITSWFVSRAAQAGRS